MLFSHRRSREICRKKCILNFLFRNLSAYFTPISRWVTHRERIMERDHTVCTSHNHIPSPNTYRNTYYDLPGKRLLENTFSSRPVSAIRTNKIIYGSRTVIIIMFPSYSCMIGSFKKCVKLARDHVGGGAKKTAITIIIIIKIITVRTSTRS